MAGPLFADRTLETSTTTGTGTYSLAGAVSGFQGFVAAVGNGNTCPYCAMAVDGNGVPNGDWEVGIGTVTDATPDTLSRDKILASSNSNNAVNWSAGTRRIFLTSPAIHALPSLEAGGRLTLESGASFSVSDQTAKTTIYYTPHAHNRIALWNGNAWVRRTFGEVSLALGTLTADKNYDVFGYDNAGTFALELSAAWTNDSTRADALTTQDGVSVKSGATTRRLLGTIRTVTTTTVEDSAAKRFVANQDNLMPRSLRLSITTDSWTYNGASWRSSNNSTANRVQWLNSRPAGVQVHGWVMVGGGNEGATGMGIDSTTAPSGLIAACALAGTDSQFATPAAYAGEVAAGFHYAQLLEYTRSGSVTFFGDGNVATFGSGIQGTVWQ